MKTIADGFVQGGFMMWPILVLSIAALTVVFERYVKFILFFRRKCVHGGKTAQEALDSLQRGFGFVSTVITAEPMLGILGTVIGIIQTFNALNVSTDASPVAATAGIGVALITTAGGLIASLILIFPYNHLLSLLQKAATRLEA